MRGDGSPTDVSQFELQLETPLRYSCGERFKCPRCLMVMTSDFYACRDLYPDCGRASGGCGFDPRRGFAAFLGNFYELRLKTWTPVSTGDDER